MLNEKTEATIYRAIKAIEFDPATLSVLVRLQRGIDVQDEEMHFVPVGPEQAFAIPPGQSVGMLDTPIYALLEAMSLDGASVSLKQLIVGLIDQALSSQ